MSLQLALVPRLFDVLNVQSIGTAAEGLPDACGTFWAGQSTLAGLLKALHGDWIETTKTHVNYIQHAPHVYAA